MEVATAHKVLHIIRRGERICSWAAAVTLVWLYAWYELWPEEEGRLRALACIILLFMVALGSTLVAGAWENLCLEVIDDGKSKEDWKEINEGRWPSG